MRKSTSSISLVLVGSALFLAGCSRDEEEEQRQGGAGRVGFIPFFIGGSRGRAGGPQGGPARTPSPGVSARGGFGSTGHFSAGA